MSGSHAAQIKQGETKRRGQERGLHVHGNQYAKPNQIYPHFLGHRHQHWHDDERNFKEIYEHAEQEYQKVNKYQETHLTTRQLVKQVLYPNVTIGCVEGETEDG